MDAFSLKGASFKGSQGYERRKKPAELPLPTRYLWGAGVAVVLAFVSAFPSLYPRFLAERVFGVERLRPVAVAVHPSSSDLTRVDVRLLGQGGSGTGQDPRIGLPDPVLLGMTGDAVGSGLVSVDLRLTPGGPLSFLSRSRSRHRAARWVSVDPATFRGLRVVYPERPGGALQSFAVPVPLVGRIPTRIERKPKDGGRFPLEVALQVDGGQWTKPLVVEESFLHPEGRRVDPGAPLELVLLTVRIGDAPGPGGLLRGTYLSDAAPTGPLVFRDGRGRVVFVPYVKDPTSYWTVDLRDEDFPDERLKEVVAEWRRDAGAG